MQGVALNAVIKDPVCKEGPFTKIGQMGGTIAVRGSKALHDYRSPRQFHDHLIPLAFGQGVCLVHQNPFHAGLCRKIVYVPVAPLFFP
jgi:hypothetical protein